MKHILISILLMWSVSAQAITTSPANIVFIPVCFAQTKYFYLNYYGKVLLLLAYENGMIGTCNE